MKISIRIVATAIAITAAISASSIAGGVAALAAPMTVPIPQLSVSVLHSMIEPGGFQVVTVVGRNTDGSPLVGKIVLTIDRHDGSGPLVVTSATNLPQYVAGRSDGLPASPIGDDTLTAVFTSSGSQPSISASASFTVRAPGASVTPTLGGTVAGSPVSVRATVTVPISGHPIGGMISVDVGSTAGVASCVPVAVSPTSASCTSSIPGTFAAATYALTLRWDNSPSFQSAFSASFFTLTPAVAAVPGAGKTGGKTPTGTIPKSAAPSASPRSSASPSSGATATATAAPAPSKPNGSPQPTVLPVTATSSTVPLWVGITITIALLALLVIAAVVTVAIVRSRRSRNAA